jgi:hypothetical protein
MRRWILVVALMALVVAACSSDSGSTTDTGPVEGVDRCEELDPLVLDFLRSGLTVDASLPWGFSVKSGDYEDVWIVTAAVEADVLDEAAYGTWAIRAGAWPSEYIGAVAVDEIAKQISSFGDDIDVIVSDSTDGVMSVQSCTVARIEAGG